MLVCDWLLSTRTGIWQQEQSVDAMTSSSTPLPSANTPLSQPEMIAYQQDLASLRKIARHIKAALPRVSRILTCLDKIVSFLAH